MKISKLKEFYPARKPYESGYFLASPLHQLYYSFYGNPKGIPVLFVHGGPGGGCGKTAHRYFNPKKFRIITIDQRGAGKSKPFASIDENTTQDLIHDFVRFLDAFEIKKTYLFGGSWGSTLSLCFAIAHPERVKGMVLRGIYLGGNLHNDYMLTGGPKMHFPEVWERFVKYAPDKKHPAASYVPKIFSSDKKTAMKYAFEWSLYEHSLLHLEFDPKTIRIEMHDPNVVSLARLESWYFKHNCFLDEGHILKNVSKIKHIPLSIIQGRYDFVCEPEMAYDLHRATPKSKLFFVTARHSSNDPRMRDRLMREIDSMAKR